MSAEFPSAASPKEIGVLRLGARRFTGDHKARPPIPDALRRLLVADAPRRTDGHLRPARLGRTHRDRDGDRFLDGDERDAGSDPAAPESTP